jgi:class 3 adenylate cyclase/TolB-like protein/Tfp pilus assembly protein PilF
MASDSEGGTRKLAAIMFTDVKDFSKKMGENEAAAMEVLKTHDDMMREVVAKHRGVIIKSLGDSFMVDFSSAVNAVQCAIEAQERFWEYNKGKSEFESVQIRVGVHLGDVIKVGNDIYGDGVNIAARIQAITEATRICISAEIYNQVKNKIPIKVFSIGMTDLKNIAEPVEVFEILLESIPELSTPSESAKRIPTRKRAEQASKQEEEEAKRVEVARQKIDEEKGREEAEKRERAGAHYAKALEYFQADQIAKAEDEIKEIYKIVQIHYEAQMLIIQIEERRAQLDEEQRKRRVKEEKLRKEEERKQRIQKVLDVALQYVDQEQYAEALNALQEVYTLEPNNEQAKRIEKQVQLAEDARLERQRQETQAEEDRVREEAAQIERQRADELAAAALQRAATRKEIQEKPKSRRHIGIAAGVVLVIAAAAVYLLTQGPLRKPSGIAVLPFATAQVEDRLLGEAFSIFVSEEIGRVDGMTVMAPTSSRTISINGSSTQQLEATLGISHVVRGSLSLSGTTVSLNAACVELAEGKTVWETALQGDVRDLGALAAQTNAALMKSLGTEIAERAVPRFSENAGAVTAYLRGLALTIQPGLEPLGQSIASLRDAMLQDSLMLTARGTLALALLEQYRRGGDRDHALLSEAAVLAQAAVSADPNNAQAHVVLGEAFLKTQQFTKARTEIQKALSIQPGIPAGNRELALLSLIEGKADEAMEYASAAQKNDPAYFESPRIKGIVQLFKMQYEDASQLFDQATRLGAPDSLLTVGFKFRAWANLDQEDKMISFCQQMMDGADDPKKVILHYWIGRAYQLKGKLDESVANFDQGSQLADRIVAQDPKSYTTFAYYALLQARRAKSPQTAVRLMQRAVTLEPSSARVHYWSARVYAIQRNKAAALGELGKAVAIEYSFPEILDPDFLSVWDDPQFAVTITKKTQ